MTVVAIGKSVNGNEFTYKFETVVPQINTTFHAISVRPDTIRKAKQCGL